MSVLHLRIHKHLSEVDAVKSHRHAFAQILCYLSKGGELVLEKKVYTVVSGALVLIPAGSRHSFREHQTRRPICLVIGLRMPQLKIPKFSVMSRSELSKVRHELARLGRLPDPSSVESRFLAASSALAILDTAFRSLGFLPHDPTPVPGVVRKLESLASDPSLFETGIEKLCEMAGGNPDYLNRLFKRHTGVTLQRHRNSVRLEMCKSELLKGGPVGRAAEASGFTDANYFSRWFRHQTGLSPTAFLRSSIRTRKKSA